MSRSRVLTVLHNAASRALALLLCVALFPLLARSQTQASPDSAATAASAVHLYDVVSIKPNKSGSGSMHLSAYETTLTAENVSLKWLTTNAFGLRDGQIVGLPPWAAAQHWDIQAKIVDPDPAWKDRRQTREESEAGYRARVQAILRERFHMKWHMETAVAPIYDLVVAKGGSKLKPAQSSDESHRGMGIHNQTLTATDLPVKSLLSFLANETGRTVEDRTELTGNFDMELKWSREDRTVTGTDDGATDKPPILFTALEEQLGLRLVPSKGPVETVVVDSVEMPVAD